MTEANKGGRPPLPEGERLAETLTVRLTAAEKAKALALGGASWVRERIQRARLPGSERKNE